MTTHAHILDALKTMEERGVEPTMQDWEAIAELIAEEDATDTDNTVQVPQQGKLEKDAVKDGLRQVGTSPTGRKGLPNALQPVPGSVAAGRRKAIGACYHASGNNKRV